MLAKLLKTLTSLFKHNKVGLLLQIMLAKAAVAGIKEILDPDNQKKAYDFVKELKASDMSNLEKAKAFNKKMLKWAKSVGKVMGESVINCLREMAVNAVKAETK